LPRLPETGFAGASRVPERRGEKNSPSPLKSATAIPISVAGDAVSAGAGSLL
jgi:hypothetical protein